MLWPYRNSDQKNPLMADTPFNDGAPLRRMNRVNKTAVCIAAISEVRLGL